MVENIFSVLTRYQVICQLQIFPAEQLYTEQFYSYHWRVSEVWVEIIKNIFYKQKYFLEFTTLFARHVLIAFKIHIYLLWL